MREENKQKMRRSRLRIVVGGKRELSARGNRTKYARTPPAGRGQDERLMRCILPALPYVVAGGSSYMSFARLCTAHF